MANATKIEKLILDTLDRIEKDIEAIVWDASAIKTELLAIGARDRQLEVIRVSREIHEARMFEKQGTFDPSLWDEYEDEDLDE